MSREQDNSSFAAILARKYREQLAKQQAEKDLAVWLYNLESEVHV